MADALSRITLLFGSSGSTPIGWSETYYHPLADLDLAIEQVVNRFVPKRLALCASNIGLTAVRASTLPPTRVTQLHVPSGKDGANPSANPAATADDPDMPQVALLARAVATNGRKRVLWLSGLADSWTHYVYSGVGVDGFVTSGPLWKQLERAFDVANLRVRWKTGPGTHDSANITSLVPVKLRVKKRGRPFGLFRGRSVV